MNSFLLGIATLILSYLSVAAIRHLTLHWSLLDIPSDRSSHTFPTPRGGGLAIVILVLIGWELWQWGQGYFHLNSYGYLLGGIIIAGVGGLDDYLGLSSKVRLLCHSFAAIVFIALVGYLDRIYLPLVGELNWGLAGIPITLFWIIGLTNAYNFMDGIDGIAGGQAIVAGSLWVYVGGLLDTPSLMMLNVLIVGASLGFLFHNAPPSRIFMGDVGSTFLGYTFATMPIMFLFETANPRFSIVGVVFVAPFVFDAGLTIFRRALNRQNLLQAHRSHIYQRLVKIGYSHGKVSVLYSIQSIVSSLLGLIYLWGEDWCPALALIATIPSLIVIPLRMAFLERQRKLESSIASRSNSCLPLK